MIIAGSVSGDRSTSAISGIGPEAAIDEHALLGELPDQRLFGAPGLREVCGMAHTTCLAGLSSRWPWYET
jgi:hypothetical protein